MYTFIYTIHGLGRPRSGGGQEVRFIGRSHARGPGAGSHEDTPCPNRCLTSVIGWRCV